MKFVRIRPYDKRRGQLVRRYVYGGFKFLGDHGWYEVDDEIAAYLKTVRTFPEDPDSKPVFDVSDQDGAKKIALAEYEETHPDRKITEAIAGAQKVTTADLVGVPEKKAPVETVEPVKAPEEPEASKTSRETKADEPGKSKRKGRFDD